MEIFTSLMCSLRTLTLTTAAMPDFSSHTPSNRRILLSSKCRQVSKGWLRISWLVSICVYYYSVGFKSVHQIMNTEVECGHLLMVCLYYSALLHIANWMSYLIFFPDFFHIANAWRNICERFWDNCPSKKIHHIAIIFPVNHFLVFKVCLYIIALFEIWWGCLLQGWDVTWCGVFTKGYWELFRIDSIDPISS